MIEGSIVIRIKRADLQRLLRSKEVVVKILDQDEDHFVVRYPYAKRDLLKNISYVFVEHQGFIRYVLSLKRNLALLFGILLFICFLFINSRTIKAIEFNAPSSHNGEIEAMIESHFRGVMGLKFLQSDLNTVNFELRKEFTEFEWIDVRKEGTVLKVTILEPNIINKKVVTREGYGDLVATESGLITSYQVQQGVLLVTRNQYVHQGDVIVSGNLNHKWPDRAPFYIAANGKVMAKVHRMKEIEVEKSMTVNEMTGRVTSNQYLTLFGLDLPLKKNEISYADFEKVELVNNLKIFDIELPFGLKKVHYYEKNDIIRTYDEKTSYEYARSIIYHELNEQLEETDEILDLLLLRQEEKEDQYSYQFLIITNENIAEFRRSHVDE